MTVAVITEGLQINLFYEQGWLGPLGLEIYILQEMAQRGPSFQCKEVPDSSRTDLHCEFPETHIPMFEPLQGRD